MHNILGLMKRNFTAVKKREITFAMLCGCEIGSVLLEQG